MTIIEIDQPSLVLLIGPAGAGKSTFAARHFRPTEIVSSDRLRGMISDDEADQSVTHQAFRLLHMLTRMRLAIGKTTVIDATNILPESRSPLLAIAAARRVPVIAIVFDVSLELCLANNRKRSLRIVDEDAVRCQFAEMAGILESLEREGYARIFRLDDSTVDRVSVTRSSP